jgi:4-amino-4-deoxy-L-arabinose transferase-like glycosyltransferase
MILVSITINANSFPRQLSWYLWLVCCGLVVCDSVLTFHDVTGYYVFHRVFDMTREESIPNWYASILLFCIGLTSLLIYTVQRAQGVLRSDASPWLFFSGFFVFLSMDDGAKIHERLGSFFRELTEEGEGVFWIFQDVLESASTYSWQIFVLPIFLFVGFFMLFWGYQHVRNMETHRWIVVGGACITIAIGADYFEGLVDNEVISLEGRALSEDTIAHYQRVIEEFLEMSGFIAVLRGLWIYLLSIPTSLSVEISK